ncbi:MAG: histidine phosphatase family protein [Anaerolineales bacterium]|nr:histidine phosphatase family protein [Anaerolineales bacterium]
MTTLYLIRHGDNDLLGKRLPGWMPGLHLNAHGRAQADRLVELLQEAAIEAIYASPLERTMETAAPLAAAKHLSIIRRPDLRDVYPGRWQGQPLASLRRRKQWPLILAAPSLASFPEGESFAQAQNRVVSELERIRRDHDRPQAGVAVFSHGDIIMLATAHYIGLPLDQFRRLSIEPASISVLHIHDRSARLIRLNDTRATQTSPPG